MKMTREEMRRKIDDWYELHLEEMLNDLGKLIAINSVRSVAQNAAPYGLGPKAALDFVASILEKRGFDVDIFEDIIITSGIGPKPALMGILAHLDVVGVDDGWDTDPFEMVIKDGKIYGRGATDNKGPSIAAVYAMFCANDLCKDLSNGFQLLLGSGEEMGCLDIAQYLEKNTPPPNVFTPDSEYPIVNTEKGRITPFFSASWDKDTTLPRIISITGGNTTNVVPNSTEAVIEGYTIEEAEIFCREYSMRSDTSVSVRSENNQLIITVEGKSSHAASPHLGANAQTAMLELLASMPFAKSSSFKYICALNRLFPHGDYFGRGLGINMNDSISGDLTVNFGVLRFSEIDFSGNFDSRTPICADAVDLLSMVRSALDLEDISITNHTHNQSHHTPENSSFVQTLLGIYELYTGNPRACLCTGGQTYVHEIPGGVAFGTAESGTDNRIHGANEFMSMEQLLTSAKMFTQTILEICM